MSGMMPLRPEIVSFDEYERLRDEALEPTSVYIHSPYTVRLRAKESLATRAEYAYDMLSIVLKVQHLGRFSVVKAKIKGFDINDKSEIEFGLNRNGIAFDHKDVPEDLEEIPYRHELGYFVGGSDGLGGGTSATDVLERIHSPEQLVALSR
jgi:hypothetical protein